MGFSGIMVMHITFIELNLEQFDFLLIPLQMISGRRKGVSYDLMKKKRSKSVGRPV